MQSANEEVLSSNEELQSINLQQDIDGYYFFEPASGLPDVPALRQQLLDAVMKGIGFQDFELTCNFRGFNSLCVSPENVRGHTGKYALL